MRGRGRERRGTGEDNMDQPDVSQFSDDSTRVQLKEGHDYINANYVNVSHYHHISTMSHCPTPY